MTGTPVFYAAAKKPGEYARVDGKRFNVSYVPTKVFGPAREKQSIKKEE